VAIKPPAAAGEAPQVPAAPEAFKPAAPLAVSAPKRETAKISRPPAAKHADVTMQISLPQTAKRVPQATMVLKKAAAPAAADKKAAPAEAAEKNVAAGKAADSDLILGIAATVVALASLGIQLWTMLG
jgi:hypothetical protein